MKEKIYNNKIKNEWKWRQLGSDLGVQVDHPIKKITEE